METFANLTLDNHSERKIRAKLRCLQYFSILKRLSEYHHSTASTSRHWMLTLFSNAWVNNVSGSRPNSFYRQVPTTYPAALADLKWLIRMPHKLQACSHGLTSPRAASHSGQIRSFIILRECRGGNFSLPDIAGPLVLLDLVWKNFTFLVQWWRRQQKLLFKSYYWWTLVFVNYKTGLIWPFNLKTNVTRSYNI